MSVNSNLDQFNKNHPWPDKDGIQSLFRFHRFNKDKTEYLTHLFVEKKIYHPLPSQLNDPFECKPHFNWPVNPKDVQAIRKHLIKIARNGGHKKRTAESLISKSMGRPKFIREAILDSIQRSFSELRICSFTASKDNLLFWAHYADSHKGFCVEFDATKMPISYAYKVRYQPDYPLAEYPRPSDARAFIPALVKAKIWEYEQEYRTIFIPEATRQPKNDGESLILSGDEIKNVYFGVNIDANHKKSLIDIIRSGSFNPKIWQAKLANSSFTLEYVECR